MRAHAEHLVRYCRPLRIEMLRFSRSTTRQSWAAAMLALAHRGELPDLPASAVGLAEAELIDTDTADWAHLWTQARQLVEQADQNLYKIVALIHARVTKPSHETTCTTCGRALTPNSTGRPAQHCSPACRTRAWRHSRGRPR